MMLLVFIWFISSIKSNEELRPPRGSRACKRLVKSTRVYTFRKKDLHLIQNIPQSRTAWQFCGEQPNPSAGILSLPSLDKTAAAVATRIGSGRADHAWPTIGTQTPPGCARAGHRRALRRRGLPYRGPLPSTSPLTSPPLTHTHTHQGERYDEFFLSLAPAC